MAFVYDAVDVEQGAHVLLAVCEKEGTSVLVGELPTWGQRVLSFESPAG